MSSLIAFSHPSSASVDDIVTSHCTYSTTCDRAMTVARSLSADECRVLLAAVLPSSFNMAQDVLSSEEQAIIQRFSQLDTGLLEAVRGEGWSSCVPTPFGRLVVWALLTDFIASRRTLEQDMSHAASHTLRGGEK